MPTLTIDGRGVEVAEGATLLDAARKLGIEIPTLCFLEGREPLTSCFVCVVKLRGKDNLVPACATVALDGMAVESDTDEVHEARRTALELLLSDHLGDCVGPCHNLCPAEMNIPLMIRQIARGELREACATVKADIPLPAVLGRICPAPCEKGCRRAAHDAAVSICLLKRYAGDAALAAPEPWLPERAAPSGKRVAIIGAGPAGLSAAFYLLQQGHAVTVFDDHPKPGGMLQYGVPEQELPRDVVDGEAAIIERLGAELRLDTRVGGIVSFDEVRGEFDAVLVAAGKLDRGEPERLGLKAGKQGIAVDRATLATSVEGVFAAGSAVRPQRMAVRAVADGKAAACSIGQFLRGEAVVGPPKLYTTRIGRLQEGEIGAFMESASDGARVEPVGDGFTDDEARAEAARCLHCDCRKPVSCKLRLHADAYGASPSRFKGDRRVFGQKAHHPDVVYESGKCIACGLCVQIAAASGEALGLTFIGRGFAVRVGVPFDDALADALAKAAGDCVAACPTGALAFREAEDGG